MSTDSKLAGRQRRHKSRLITKCLAGPIRARWRNGWFDRCHSPDILADMTAIGARAPAHFRAARCSCSVSSTFARPLCRDHRWQSDIDLDVGLPAAVDADRPRQRRAIDVLENLMQHSARQHRLSGPSLHRRQEKAVESSDQNSQIKGFGDRCPGYFVGK